MVLFRSQPLVDLACRLQPPASLCGVARSDIHECLILEDDSLVIRPGMVFTVEPGLYASNLGGFRHSDTVLITEDGMEILTYYPRDLESLVIES